MKFRPIYLYALIKPIFLLLMSIGLIVSAEYFLILKQYLFYPITILFLAYCYNVLLVITIKYELSEEQLLITKGLFSIETNYLELYRIKDLKINNPFLARLIGAYNLTIYTSDKTDPILLIKGINQKDFSTTLRTYVETNRRLKGVFEVD